MNAPKLRAWVLRFFGVVLFATIAVGCCGVDTTSKPDAGPKFDACDPTISRICADSDGGAS
jgi:hypothetical protein